MSSQPSQKTGLTPSKFARYAFILVFSVVVLIAINAHLQNPVLVFGGAATVAVAVLAHLGVFAGLIKIVSSWRKNRQ